jgi:hypothetical protein
MSQVYQIETKNFRLPPPALSHLHFHSLSLSLTLCLTNNINNYVSPSQPSSFIRTPRRFTTHETVKLEISTIEQPKQFISATYLENHLVNIYIYIYIYKAYLHLIPFLSAS